MNTLGIFIDSAISHEVEGLVAFKDLDMETQTLLLQSLFMSWRISEKSFKTKDSTHSVFNDLLLFFLLSDC